MRSTRSQRQPDRLSCTEQDVAMRLLLAARQREQAPATVRTLREDDDDDVADDGADDDTTSSTTSDSLLGGAPRRSARIRESLELAVIRNLEQQTGARVLLGTNDIARECRVGDDATEHLHAAISNEMLHEFGHSARRSSGTHSDTTALLAAIAGDLLKKVHEPRSSDISTASSERASIASSLDDSQTGILARVALSAEPAHEADQDDTAALERISDTADLALAIARTVLPGAQVVTAVAAGAGNDDDDDEEDEEDKETTGESATQQLWLAFQSALRRDEQRPSTCSSTRSSLSDSTFSNLPWNDPEQEQLARRALQTLTSCDSEASVTLSPPSNTLSSTSNRTRRSTRSAKKHAAEPVCQSTNENANLTDVVVSAPPAKAQRSRRAAANRKRGSASSSASSISPAAATEHAQPATEHLSPLLSALPIVVPEIQEHSPASVSDNEQTLNLTAVLQAHPHLERQSRVRRSTSSRAPATTSEHHHDDDALVTMPPASETEPAVMNLITPSSSSCSVATLPYSASTSPLPIDSGFSTPSSIGELPTATSPVMEIPSLQIHFDTNAPCSNDSHPEEAPEPEPEPELQAAPDHEPEAELEPELQAAPDHEHEPELEPELQAAPDLEPELEPEPELQAAPDHEHELEPEPEPEPELQAVPEMQAEVQPSEEDEAESKSQSKKRKRRPRSTKRPKSARKAAVAVASTKAPSVSPQEHQAFVQFVAEKQRHFADVDAFELHIEDSSPPRAFPSKLPGIEVLAPVVPAVAAQDSPLLLFAQERAAAIRVEATDGAMLAYELDQPELEQAHNHNNHSASSSLSDLLDDFSDLESCDIEVLLRHTDSECHLFPEEEEEEHRHDSDAAFLLAPRAQLGQPPAKAMLFARLSVASDCSNVTTASDLAVRQARNAIMHARDSISSNVSIETTASSVANEALAPLLVQIASELSKPLPTAAVLKTRDPNVAAGRSRGVKQTQRVGAASGSDGQRAAPGHKSLRGRTTRRNMAVK